MPLVLIRCSVGTTEYLRYRNSEGARASGRPQPPTSIAWNPLFVETRERPQCFLPHQNLCVG